jgi:hypothetical protein
MLVAMAGQQPNPSSAPSASLNYEFFKTRVQPIFLAKRPGHARCIACHGSGTPLRLQPLSPGSTTWNDEESRKNFEAIQRVADTQGICAWTDGEVTAVQAFNPFNPFNPFNLVARS